MNPPPLPHGKGRRQTLIIFIVLGTVLAVGILGLIGFRGLIASGITKGFDNKFGDQHLKTAVALIELYKVRYGRYPDSLHELKFLGDWDQIVLYTVAYYPSADRKSYYVEVTRGWMGKPDLTEPDEFWRGTGFSAALKPKDR